MTAHHSADPPDKHQPASCRYMADFDGARLYVHARSLGTVLRVDGEIDVLNAHDVAQTIRRFARLKTPLILDMSQLDFLSLDGFRALLALNRELQQARVHCSVVAGAAMRPLLHTVNDHGLPVVGSVAEALQLIEDIVRARHRLIADALRHRQAQPTAVVAVPS